MQNDFTAALPPATQNIKLWLTPCHIRGPACADAAILAVLPWKHIWFAGASSLAVRSPRQGETEGLFVFSFSQHNVHICIFISPVILKERV